MEFKKIDLLVWDLLVWEDLDKDDIIWKVNNKIKNILLEIYDYILSEEIDEGSCNWCVDDIGYEWLKKDFEGDFCVVLNGDRGGYSIVIYYKNEMEEEDWRNELVSDFVRISYVGNRLEILKSK